MWFAIMIRSARRKRTVVRLASDSPVEGNGFKSPVPREIGSGFEESAELGPIDRRRLEEPSFAAE
jgi:hypothetical protein